MPLQTSFHTVAEQVLTFNQNLVDSLNKITQLITTTNSSVTINIADTSGVIQQFTLPSFGFLMSEINRLNNNINQIYNINGSGSLIQPSSSNIWQKIVTVDLNAEPNDISNLTTITSFESNVNWFFEGLVNPELFIQIDLSGQIETNVRQVLSQRFIVEFETDAAGNYTASGQSGLNSFNTLYRGVNNIVYNDFLTWIQTTPGVVNPNNPTYDEQMFSLEPNVLQYDGMFTVYSTETDTLNSKLWYVLNTLNYIDTQTSQVNQLAVNDELIINITNSSTVYQIVEISTAETNPRIRLQRTEGNQPIPIGVDTLKIYSPVLYTREVQISIGYNEYNVIFIKPLNGDNYILSKNWSLGTGFWTNDLRLSSSDNNNGSTMEQYYIDNVQDYGAVIKDLVSKSTPTKLGSVPNVPVLDVNNFKVLQTNTHLTDTPNSTLLKNKNTQQTSLKAQVDQLNQAITDKNKQLKITRFTSDSAKNQFMNELNSLNTQKQSASSLLNSTTQDILNASTSPVTNIAPVFAVRGFWNIPDPVISNGTQPQQVIQFNVQYKYLSSDGTETPITTFKLTTSNAVASFSNWNALTTSTLQRVYNAATEQYSWVEPDLSNPDVPNINQIDIPIQYGESVQIRVQSISEVGWPSSPLTSDWSDPITIDFPSSLNSVTNQNSAIITTANNTSIQNSIQSNLTAQGLDDLLSQKTVVNNNTYYLDTSTILSGFTDANGVAIDLYDYLSSLQATITALQEQINQSKGLLQVTIFNNSNQFIVKNGSSLSFTIECEDYLDPFTGTGIPTGRVYSNDIYVIKDFLLQISNTAASSELGLLSTRIYDATNVDVYNQTAPQCFWVDNQNNLLFSNQTGSTETQLDNQFIWQVNYDNVTSTTVTKLSDNIGNSFVANNSNSITKVLSSPEFSVGYSENTTLAFLGNNTSLLDSSKWIDTSVSVSSTTKLLTTIHPSIQDSESIVQTNSDKLELVDPGISNAINIPINIYFKMNSLDSSQSGLNYQYINLNSAKTTVRHTKEIKFLLDNSSDNRPFIFSINFTINRNKVIINKTLNTVTQP